MARSRGHAAELVADGRVAVSGRTAAKPATMVEAASAILVAPPSTGTEYVSRGGHKLRGALVALSERGQAPLVEGRRCLDAGASTGGFTDVLLRTGAAEVVAVDVGYGQLAWSLRGNHRVQVHDRTNVRSLTAQDIGGPVDLVVADLSFISLRLVLPALLGCLTADGDLLLMVKPQFEVGAEYVGKGGVVREPTRHVQAVADVVTAARAIGLHLWDVVPSPLPGPSGNVEYFVWFRRDPSAEDSDEGQDLARITAAVAAAPPAPGGAS